MRSLWLLPLLLATPFFGQAVSNQTSAQSGCPSLSFSGASSAALAASPSTHRILAKQGDGSYTAFDIANTSPYTVLRSMPHFERDVRTCAPSTTRLDSFNVIAAARTKTGGYILASDVNVDGDVLVTVFDSALNLIGQVPEPSSSNVVFADVNGDGNIDIIASAFANIYGLPTPVSISYGTGGAGFLPPVSFLFPGFVNGSPIVADVNGDGRPDVVVPSGSAIWALLGNADGTLQPAKTLVSATQPGAVAFADLNGDGKPDLAFTDYTPLSNSIVAVALGAGNGTFATPVQYPAMGTNSIAIGDLNGDGIPDIATNGVTILFGDGKGGFPTSRNVFLEADNIYASANVIITDFDGNGVADIVAAVGGQSVMTGDSVSVLFGLGSGAFTGPPASVVQNVPSNLLYDLSAAGSADVNGDGIPDLVAGGRGGMIDVLKGVGDGSFQTSFTAGFAVGDPIGIAFGDFNHDGNVDFAMAGSSATEGEVAILLGKGDGTFQAPLQISAPTGAVGLAAGDFNNDGKLDLALLESREVSGASDSIRILLGNGDGSFSQGAIYPIGPNAISIAAGDFNGDGKLDLMATDLGSTASFGGINPDGNVVLLSGKGDGTFAAPAAMPFFGPRNLAVADFNRDGKLDVALTISQSGTSTGGLQILLGQGDGTFQATTYAVSALSAFPGDLNGDGIPDLVTTSGNVNYLLGRGDGSFEPPVLLDPAAGSPWTPIALGDFNHDGKLDIAGLASTGIVAFLNSPQPPPSVTIVSAASLAPGPLAPDSLATAFGTNLPASGASVSVTDVTGTTLPASVLYSSSAQINFAIPAGLDAGPATVAIGSLSVPIVLAPFAPSLFAVNAEGLAAAYVTRISPGGAVTNQPVFSLQNGVATPVPIDVSPAAGEAYLILFGTGIRNAGAEGFAINGGAFGITYIGPQPSAPGLDQINIPLPAAYAGSGVTRLDLNVDGLAANAVYIDIK